jgi:hypothetical protein
MGAIQQTHGQIPNRRVRIVAAKSRQFRSKIQGLFRADFADKRVMQGSANKQPAIPRVQITLDGQPVPLATNHGRSLQAIRAHLERVALKRQRVLFSLTVNGTPVSLGESLSPFKTFHKIAARTIRFDQLGFQLVAVAADQVNTLHERVERLALQVMINEWPKAEQLWLDLMPELKDPLLTLSFVPPNVEFLPHGQEIGAKAVKRFTIDLAKILENIEEILTRKELLELSDALENDLLPWLRSLGHCLYRFHGPEPV